MDANQKKYAMKRIADQLSLRLTLLREKCMTVPKKLTDDEKLSLIRNQDVSLYRTAKLTDTIDDAFDFRYRNPEPELDRKSYESQERVLRNTASFTQDAVMLGDEKEAMKLIKEFCGN